MQHYAASLEQLNQHQKRIVSSPHKRLFVLAGAGSGKTRVLVHRIAWLIRTRKYSPHSIVAVTFTNKAAEEMRRRIRTLIGTASSQIWIGTFHGLSHRILHRHHAAADLPKNFCVIDVDDQMRLLKRLVDELKLDERTHPLRRIALYINSQKDKGVRPGDIETRSGSVDRVWKLIYAKYQDMCRQLRMVDFAELLLRSYELFVERPLILRHYQTRFQCILVDEFQDTNSIQYAWIRKLSHRRSNIMIVGDDDQSIYGWRGAQVENIQKFLRDFVRVETIYLEQNYRSTNNILKSANVLISHNKVRLGKRLWTKQTQGEPIFVYRSTDELDEADFVARCVSADADRADSSYRSGILYRNNFQSRLLEEALLKTGVPYRIHGGIRFFERQEIKNAVAYLRLIVNRNDDGAFERVVNFPRRGIGPRTLTFLKHTAQARNFSLWETVCAILDRAILPKNVIAALRAFVDLVDALTHRIAFHSLHRQIDAVLRMSGVYRAYAADKNQNQRVCIENLKELVVAARQFAPNPSRSSKLAEFLSHVSLNTKECPSTPSRDRIQMMTIHASKGMEFDRVFVVGLEEGIFPHSMSLHSARGLEEERRLAYVAITRAMKRLVLTYSRHRQLYGKKKTQTLSRFVDELPLECLRTVSSHRGF